MKIYKYIMYIECTNIISTLLLLLLLYQSQNVIANKMNNKKMWSIFAVFISSYYRFYSILLKIELVSSNDKMEKLVKQINKKKNHYATIKLSSSVRIFFNTAWSGEFGFVEMLVGVLVSNTCFSSASTKYNNFVNNFIFL